MWTYIVRRACIGIVLLLTLSLVTFAMFLGSPNLNPAKKACGKNCNETQIAFTKKVLGYDQPVVTQWGSFVKGVVVGRDYPASKELREADPNGVSHCAAPCLGYSKINETPVNDVVKDAIPITLSLAMLAVVLWLLFGVLLGVVAAVFKGRVLDRLLVGLTLVAYAFPTFFIATILLKFGAVKWGLWPEPTYTAIADGGVGAWFAGLILPAITLALVYMASYTRITRAFVIESMQEDYIRTAKAKGLAQRKVLFKHGLRAALTPLVTMVGLDFAALLGGAIITESVFGYQGLGYRAVEANSQQDLPILVALVVLAGAFVIVANIVVDVLYAVIDPRVRLG